MLTTNFDLEAYNTIDKALKELKTKTQYPYARMVGYLMCNVNLTDAKRIAKIISEMEVQND
jgi:hypothetical protein